MGTQIQMVGATTGGTEAALANIDVPRNGNLVGVSFAGRVDFDTDNDFCHVQISFGSTVSTTNDSRQVIANWQAGHLTFTAGGSLVGGGNAHIPLPNIPVGMGERLYLHGISAAGVVGVIYAMLQFDFDLDQALVRRR